MPQQHATGVTMHLCRRAAIAVPTVRHYCLAGGGLEDKVFAAMKSKQAYKGAAPAVSCSGMK
jgi:hypothetical protein